MHRRHHLTPRRSLLTATVTTAAAVLLPASAALASPGQVSHDVDVTGAVFTCAGGVTYTATSGTATFLFHDSIDAAGGEHLTGTVAPTQVVLAGSNGGTYSLAGASWFGGNLTASGGSNFTDTEHFVIRTATGGLVAKVQIVSHTTLLADGTVVIDFEKNTGACTPPE